MPNQNFLGAGLEKTQMQQHLLATKIIYTVADTAMVPKETKIRSNTNIK